MPIKLKADGSLSLSEIAKEFPEPPPAPRKTTLESIELLIVGGGGSGSTRHGGGGGAGGLLVGSFPTGQVTYGEQFDITVGAGGTGTGGGGGRNGEDSSAFGAVAKGGGGSGSYDVPAKTGGSGGGAPGGSGANGSHGGTDAGTIKSIFGDLTFHGNPGGDGNGGDHGGGGGGAGSSGNSGGHGNGGEGFQWHGSWYAAGGSGGFNGYRANGIGGPGGERADPPANNGADGTGSGGGGGRYDDSSARKGGTGGTGIVIFRYKAAAPRFSGGDITQDGEYQVHTFRTSGKLTNTDVDNTPAATSAISLSMFYAGGKRVPAGTAGEAGPIPTSGTIKISDFYGAPAFDIQVTSAADNVYEAKDKSSVYWWWTDDAATAPTMRTQATSYSYPGYGWLYASKDSAGNIKSKSIGSNKIFRFDGNYDHRDGNAGNSGSDMFYFRMAEHPELVGKTHKVRVRVWAGGGAGKDWRGNEGLGQNAGGGGAYFTITDAKSLSNGFEIEVGRGGVARRDGGIGDSWGHGGSGGPSYIKRLSSNSASETNADLTIASIAPGRGSGWGAVFNENTFDGVAQNVHSTNPTGGQGVHSEWGGGSGNQGTAGNGGGRGGGSQGQGIMAQDPAGAGQTADSSGPSARGGNGRVYLTFDLD